MSITELVVIALGLVFGYWVVSLGVNGKPDQPRANRQPGLDGDGQKWHEILQVAPSAGVDEIRHAYQTLIAQYSPDKVASLGPELRELCERKSREINAAYQHAMAARSR